MWGAISGIDCTDATSRGGSTYWSGHPGDVSPLLCSTELIITMILIKQIFDQENIMINFGNFGNPKLNIEMRRADPIIKR